MQHCWGSADPLEQVVNVFISDCAVLALQTTRDSMQIDLRGQAHA